MKNVKRYTGLIVMGFVLICTTFILAEDSRSILGPTETARLRKGAFYALGLKMVRKFYGLLMWESVMEGLWLRTQGLFAGQR